MASSPHITVRVDLGRIRRNAEAIAREAAVPLIAVVKADAYGLGAKRVAAAVGDLADAFYVFDAAEVVEHDLYRLTGKRSIALLGESNDAADYLAHRIHPAVWTDERAMLLQKARPALSVDTGQGRFGCPLEEARGILARTGIREAFTHATTAGQAGQFDVATRDAGCFRHAAGTALLDDPPSRFDAVRPGLGLYVGAARVSARLIESRESRGPAGYTGFLTSRHGVIRCGYSNGLRPGPCLVNGARRRILEVGMQSAFVELGPADRDGNEVILLGDHLSERDIAAEWRCAPQEVLLRLTGAGAREYIQGH
jgi:alanine racemase